MAQVSVPDAKKMGEAIYEFQSTGGTSETDIAPDIGSLASYDLFDKYRCPGKFIIFNHFQFDDSKLTARIGTDKDAERLERTFKNLGFQEAIKRQTDLTVEEIKKTLEHVLHGNFDDYGSIIVIILTHGELRKLHARDEQYEIEDIKEFFINKEVATKLAGKPKIFIIQACQGEKADDGVDAPSYGEVGDSGDTSAEDEKVIKIPIMADFLFAVSSASGYISFREKHGTWFIQTLCKAIEQLSKTEDFERILTIVKYAIAYKKSSYNPVKLFRDKKQIPEVTSTFTKLLNLTKQ